MRPKSPSGCFSCTPAASFTGTWSWTMCCWTRTGILRLRILECARKTFNSTRPRKHSAELLTTSPRRFVNRRLVFGINLIFVHNIRFRSFCISRTENQLTGGRTVCCFTKCWSDSHRSMVRTRKNCLPPSRITMFHILRAWAKRRRTFVKGWACRA